MQLTNRTILAGAFFGVAVISGCEEVDLAPVYQMVPVEYRDISLSASAAGAIEPVQTVEVKSKASGEIYEVRVDIGDNVTRGQLLVRVDQRVPGNAVAQAEADSAVAQAQLEISESQLSRSERLYESQSITEQEFENARLSRANANAQLIRAQRQLEDARIAYEDTEVRAPSNGIILTRTVEVGNVIQSASSGLSGGQVLLTMADLDTVQVRTLVDETDIGKINPGLRVTITVDAYPNQPFRGRVLKVEPAAVTEQNVTMFPVLIRIANEQTLLRPGMNSEVDIQIGEADQVLTVPNAALRTQRDVASAASVLGLDMDVVAQQLAAAQNGADEPESAPMGDDGASNTITMRGREIELPAGVTREQMQPILDKMANGNFQSLSSDERALMQRVMRSAGEGAGPGGGRGGRGGRQTANASQYQFGGEYIVFVMRNGEPTAVAIETGLTDLDYSEVRDGLAISDTVLILPSASLIAQQQQMQERIQRITGGVPGVGGGGRRR